jgi:hypothetical protein
MSSRSTVMDNDGKIKKRESGQRDLEMNHSHYLMLDDGRLRFYDIGDYRTRLCVEIAKLQHENAFPSKYIELNVYLNKYFTRTIEQIYISIVFTFCSSCCYYCG